MLAQLTDDVFSSSALAPHDLLTSLLSETFVQVGLW